jgi:hypothetical protein
VGAEIALGEMKLLIDLRYYLGLTDVYESTEFSMKNRGFMLTAGFLF